MCLRFAIFLILIINKIILHTATVEYKCSKDKYSKIKIHLNQYYVENMLMEFYTFIQFYEKHLQCTYVC